MKIEKTQSIFYGIPLSQISEEVVVYNYNSKTKTFQELDEAKQKQQKQNNKQEMA